MFPVRSLLVDEPNFQIVELGISELFAHVMEGVLELVLQMLRI